MHIIIVIRNNREDYTRINAIVIFFKLSIGLQFTLTMNDALLTIFFSRFARNRGIWNRNGRVDLSHHCCRVILVSLETSMQSVHPSSSVSKTGDSAQWRYWSSSIDPCISVIHSRSTNHMICQNSPRASRVLWYHLEGIWKLIFAPGGMVKLKSQIYGSMNLSMLLLATPYASALSSVSARWLESDTRDLI